MDNSLHALQAECDRAAAEFLAMEGWASSKVKVRTVVDELVAGTGNSTARLSWLLGQVSRLPVRSEPARRLHDLVEAAAALQARKRYARNEGNAHPAEHDLPNKRPTSLTEGGEAKEV